MTEGVHTRVTAAAKLLGVPVQVTEADAWGVHEGAVVVGTRAYGALGAELSDDALTALIMLDLWVVGRLPVGAERRTQQRVTLGATRPEVEPLLVTLDRLQAAGEMLTAFPGFRAGLEVSTAAMLARDLSEATADLQWLALLLGDALSRNATVAVSGEVLEERIGAETLWVAMAPLADPHPEQTFARLLALTLDPYERLLASRSRGLATHGEHAERQASEGDIGSEGFEQGGEGDDADAVQGDAGSASEDASAQEGNEQARAGEGPEQAEGADLFEAQKAGEVKAMLDTPMPLSSEAARALSEWEVNGAEAQGQGGQRESVAAARALGQVRLATYRERVASRESDIEALRAVFEQLIAERKTPLRRESRVAETQGETLMRQALPGAVAEALSGVARPRAYARRERVIRRREEPGNLDIVLLIDRSGSMRHVAPVAADAALVVIEALAAVARDVETEERRLGIDLDMRLRTALIVFDAEPVLVKPLAAANDDASRARLLGEALSSSGGTNDARALELAMRELGIERATGGTERQRLVIVISDGGSDDELAARALLQHMRARGVTVFGLGMRSDELVARYAPTAQRVDDARDLAGALERLIIDAAA